jgi:hypothetical protein
LALLFACSFLQAQTTWTGFANSDWFNPANWTAGVPSAVNQPAVVPIPTPNQPDVNAPLTIDFQLDVYDRLRFFADVTNMGNLTVYGSGWIRNAPGVTFLNTPTGNVHLFGEFRNLGTFVNAATVANEGIYRNRNGGNLVNLLLFDNQAGSSFVNENLGRVDNNDAFFISGTASNAATGVMVNNAAFTVTSLGTLTNNGQIWNENATFDLNGGTLTNNNWFANNGELTNDFGSTFTNNGTLLNGPCDFIYHFTANPINAGIVTNNGVIYAIVSPVTITGGTGTTFNNLGSFAAPTAWCHTSITLPLDLANTATLTAVDVDSASVAGYCGLDAMWLSRYTFDCSDVGSVTVTLTVRDSLGAIAQCQSTIIVQDTVPPSIVCQNDTTVVNEPGLCGATINYAVPVGTDNCPGVTTSFVSGIGSGGFFPVGTFVETYATIDIQGNTDTCSITVTVLDVGRPAITCPGDLTIDLLPFECSRAVSFAVSATDNCTAAPFIYQIDGSGLSSGSDFPIGVNTLIFVARDGSGNTDTCSFSITVNEYLTTSDALVCNDDAQLSLDSDCISEVTAQMILMGDYGCEDDFVVEIQGRGNNVITISDVGLTFNVMVTQAETGIMCWGRISVEDKLPPMFENCVGDTLLCIENFAPVTHGGDAAAPTMLDCTGFEYLYFDEYQQNDCSSPYSAKIVRTWLAEDVYGLKSSCVQEIYVQRLSLDANPPTCPPNVELACNGPNNYNLSPDSTGYPTIVVNGSTYELSDTTSYLCGLVASHTDDTLDMCGAGFKILRTWGVIDWCMPIGPGNPWTCVQTIKVVDRTAPTISINSPILINTNSTSCLSNAILPPATILDCSPYTVLIYTPVGVINGNSGAIPGAGLGLGSHTVTYLATDACGNQSSRTATVVIHDTRPPVPVCDRVTKVSLTENGPTILYATTLDDGSNDNCCLRGFAVRQLEDHCGTPADTTFQPQITFCCADAGDTIMVILRVYDCAGNFNDCIVTVIVDYKIPPVFECPDTIYLDCGVDYNDLTLTGDVVTSPVFRRPKDGLASTSCGILTITYSDAVSVSCGAGTVVRTWQAADQFGNSTTCNQLIYLVNRDPFDAATDVVWPRDTTFYNCNFFPDTTVTGRPVVTTDACDQIAVFYRDEPPGVNGNGTCRQIYRTWVVIDWCQYVPNILPVRGYWEYTQEITVIDAKAPVINLCQDRIFCNSDDRCLPLVVNLSVEAFDNCTLAKDLDIRWVVDAFADGVPDAGPLFNGTGLNIGNAYPLGTHRICYTVIDECGNQTSCCFNFKILDCKAPIPICKNGLSASLNMDGTLVLPAVFFEDNGRSSDNCSRFRNLRFSYSSNTNDTLKTFNCSTLGINSIQFWVTDETGNQAFCTTFIDIQDNMGACTTPRAAIAGAVKNEKGSAVSDVTMQVSGDASSPLTTGDNGEFMFGSLPLGQDYSVVPQRDDDADNGVSTFDLVLITKHILGVQLLDSPYKIIAADANHSNTVTTLDVVTLRKLILHIEERFTKTTSWRFVRKDFQFPNPANPWQTTFPEVYNVNNLAADEVNANFIAIKTGDVNASAKPNSLLGIDQRTFAGKAELQFEDRVVRKGELVTILFTTGKNESLAGCQFTLDFAKSKLELADAESGVWSIRENLGLTLLTDGAITLSWDNPNQQTLLHGQTLFSLRFRALADGSLREWLSLSSRYTAAEAYNTAGELLEVSLNPDNTSQQPVTTGYELYQNIPNPFSDQTAIGFNLPVAGQAKLSLFDLSGRLLKVVEGQFKQGFNDVRISKSELDTYGIIHYRLETANFTATRKMILLDH